MKKLFALCLALVLCAALTAPVFADVWIPPTDGGGNNETLEALPQNGEAAEPETGTASASSGLTGRAVTILVIVVALLAAGAAAVIIVVWRKKR